MLKKVSALVLALALCLSLATTAMATPLQGEISPRLLYITSVSARLTSSGAISVTVGGKASINEIEITVTVQEKDGSSWVDVDEFSTETTYDYSASFNDTTYAMSAGTSYRVKAYVKAYTDGGYDITTKYSTAVTAR